MYNEGISVMGDLIDVGVATNVLDKRGTFIMFEGTRIGQGRENAKVYLKEHPEVANKIDGKVRDGIASGQASKAANVTQPEAGEDDGEDPSDE